jgi:hypothetical protein
MFDVALGYLPKLERGHAGEGFIVCRMAYSIIEILFFFYDCIAFDTP